MIMDHEEIFIILHVITAVVLENIAKRSHIPNARPRPCALKSVSSAFELTWTPT